MSYVRNNGVKDPRRAKVTRNCYDLAMQPSSQVSWAGRINFDSAPTHNNYRSLTVTYLHSIWPDHASRRTRPSPRLTYTRINFQNNIINCARGREGLGTRLVLAAAEGVITARNRSALLKYGGHIDLGRPWAVSILQRMGCVQRRGSTQTKAKLSDQQVSQMKHTYLSQVSGMVKVHKIPSELVINWDQAGVNLIPSQNWTMEQKGSSRVEIAGINDKHQITLTLAGSMSGELPPIQLLYQGKTTRCHPQYSYPPEFDVWHTPHHWANEETTIRFISNVILPYPGQK